MGPLSNECYECVRQRQGTLDISTPPAAPPGASLEPLRPIRLNDPEVKNAMLHAGVYLLYVCQTSPYLVAIWSNLDGFINWVGSSRYREPCSGRLTGKPEITTWLLPACLMFRLV